MAESGGAGAPRLDAGGRRGMTARRGRPPVPPEERRSRRVAVRLTQTELRELVAWAERERTPLAEAMRDAALRAARWRP